MERSRTTTKPSGSFRHLPGPTTVALVKRDLRDFEGAIKDHDKAIRLHPNLRLPTTGRGLAKYDLTDYAGAIKDYDQPSDLTPT